MDKPYIAEEMVSPVNGQSVWGVTGPLIEHPRIYPCEDIAKTAAALFNAIYEAGVKKAEQCATHKAAEDADSKTRLGGDW